MLRWVLLVVGVLALVSGLTWMAQGSGIFPYPRQSFMIDQTPWIWRGGVVAVCGAICAVVSRRVGRV